MNRIELADKLNAVSIDLEKSRFVASEIIKVFEPEFDNLALQAYEVERNKPLANILLDYVVSADTRLKELEKAI